MTGGFQTYLTFYDFDTLGAQANGLLRAIECVMADATSGSIITHLHMDPQTGLPNTQLTQHQPQEVMFGDSSPMDLASTWPVSRQWPADEARRACTACV